jgi:hypothetical protein
MKLALPSGSLPMYSLRPKLFDTFDQSPCPKILDLFTTNSEITWKFHLHQVALLNHQQKHYSKSSKPNGPIGPVLNQSNYSTDLPRWFTFNLCCSGFVKDFNTKWSHPAFVHCSLWTSWVAPFTSYKMNCMIIRSTWSSPRISEWKKTQHFSLWIQKAIPIFTPKNLYGFW